MYGEGLTLQSHGFESHMHQDVLAAFGLESEGMLRGCDHAEGAVHRCNDFSVFRNHRCTVTHHFSGKNRVRNLIDGNDFSIQGQHDQNGFILSVFHCHSLLLGKCFHCISENLFMQ